MDKKNGSKSMPDFDELNDRLIANASQSPGIQIKTNFDSDNVMDENPYFKNKGKLSSEEKQMLNDFFNQD